MDQAAHPLGVSPLFPLLLFSLTSERYSPLTKEEFKSEYDYVVVGAGSAGSVIASRLSELFCVSVLLLEAGDAPPILTEVPGLAGLFGRGDTSWNFQSTPQKYAAAGFPNRQVSLPAGKTLGGSSTINGMLYSRGNPSNYDIWEALGAAGWGYKDVLPYFKKLESNQDLEYLLNGYHGTSGPITVAKPKYQPEVKAALVAAIKQAGYNFTDINGPKQAGFFDLQATIRKGRRCGTAKAYLVPSEHRSNLDILSGAFVKKIIIKNRRATGVVFDFRGKTHTVKAKSEVIISAGSINTAKLLMLSGIGPKTHLKELNIPVVANLPVGLNLQDHFGNFILFQVDKAIPTITSKLMDTRNILEYIKNKSGPLTTTYEVILMAFLSNLNPFNPDSGPDHGLYFIEVDASFARAESAGAEVFRPLAEQLGDNPTVMCLSLAIHPKSRGWVRLQSSNPYEAPLINPNFYEDEEDFTNVVLGLKKCLDIMSKPFMSSLGAKPLKIQYPGCTNFTNLDAILECATRNMLVSSSHFSGTARMGHPKDPSTVVDPQLRVKTISGLRVVDASIMPRIIWGHTNVPTIMIAEKAADMIKETIPIFDESCAQRLH